jgi:hypothetical protein
MAAAVSTFNAVVDAYADWKCSSGLMAIPGTRPTKSSKKGVIVAHLLQNVTPLYRADLACTHMLAEQLYSVYTQLKKTEPCRLHIRNIDVSRESIFGRALRAGLSAAIPVRPHWVCRSIATTGLSINSGQSPKRPGDLRCYPSRV